MPVTVEDNFDGTEHTVPEHIVERTENLLGRTPMTNQSIILDTAQWWFDHVGNCAIYQWCIHHLDTLENDEVDAEFMVFTEAVDEASDYGFDV